VAAAWFCAEIKVEIENSGLGQLQSIAYSWRIIREIGYLIDSFANGENLSPRWVRSRSQRAAKNCLSIVAARRSLYIVTKRVACRHCEDRSAQSGLPKKSAALTI
jgi:hypothetical protein